GITRKEAPNGAACRLFRHLSRSRAVLSDVLAGFLRPEYANRVDVRFSTKRGGRCIQYDRRPDLPADIRRTIAYFVNVPSIWPDGPGLIWSFAPSGEAGLLWNRMLCQEYWHLLERPCFVMAEFNLPPRLKEKAQEDYGPGILNLDTERGVQFVANEE